MVAAPMEVLSSGDELKRPSDLQMLVREHCHRTHAETRGEISSRVVDEEEEEHERMIFNFQARRLSCSGG